MRRFHESIHTTATGADIWNIWAHVEKWNKWDSTIEHAQLEGPFQEGQLGRIKRTGLPESEFFLSNVREGKSFTINMLLPANTRIEDWFILIEGKKTREVIHGQRYQGLLSWPYAIKLARAMREGVVESLEFMKRELEGENYVPSTSQVLPSGVPDLDMEKDVNIKY